MKRFDCAIILLFIGASLADENVPNLENIVELVTGIPGLENFNASALPNVEQASDLLKKKCEKNGDPEAYERANKGKDVVVECLKGLINMTELQREIEIAKPVGELDTVFKKYCGRKGDLKKCIENFTQSFQPCLEPKEKENLKIVMNITDALLDFTCYKDGDRIALFISAEGPECFQSKQGDLQECLNSTFGSYAPVSSLSDAAGDLTDIQSLPSLLFGLKECQDIHKLQICSVEKLETCKDPTPGNIVEALFDFIKKSTPCAKLLRGVGASARLSVGEVNSAQIIYSTFISLFMLVSLRFI